jgi:hypothetical protein
VDVCNCKVCAMLRTKDSSTNAKHTNVQENDDSIVNECNVLKNGKVCFSENINLWQMNLLQYRTPQYPEYVNNRVCDTHTCDCEGYKFRVVIPFAKHVTEGKRRLRRLKNASSLDSVRNKEGQRLDMFYILICIIATSYSLASSPITFLPLHTCFPFTSPRVSCITQGATHLQ